jgi:hypothetical protein
MNLYRFQPRQYVDVLPDLPVEWLQGQVDKKQGVIDAQRKDLNASAENFMKLNYGAFGRDIYDQVNKDYQGRFKQMTEDLLTRQDIPGVSSTFSNLIREAAFDPRIKDLNKEYAAYQKFLENKMDPNYYNAIDMSKLGKQIGQDWNVDQAIGSYNLVKYEDSIQPYVQTAQQFNPYKDSKTNQWIFTNPITKESFASTDKEEVEKVSRERLEKWFEESYYNWDMDGRSKYDKLSATNVDVDQFDPNFRFKDENLGRQIWRQKYTPYLNMAYTKKEQESKVTPMGGGTPNTTPPNPNKPADVKPLEYNQTSPTYGINLLGYRLSTGEPISTVYDGIANTSDYKERINTLNNQMIEANKQGNPNAVLALDKERQQLMSELTTWESWQKVIEAELYGKVSNSQALADAEAGYATYVAHALMIKPPGENNPEQLEEYKKALQNKYALKAYIRKYNPTKGGVYDESAISFLNDGADWREIEDKDITNSLGKDSIEYKKREKWEKYINYQTQGKSYQPNTDAARQRLDALVTSLITTGKKPYDLKTDKEVSDFPSLQKYLMQLQAESGSFNTKGLSTEILLDEEDGPVLVLHGLNIDGSKGADIPNSIEFDIRDTPSLLNTLYEIDPQRQVANNYFVDAARSLKENKNKKGSFTMNSYGNVQEEVKFTREPIGDGKYIFKDSNNAYYASLNDLIETRIFLSAEKDKDIQAGLDRLSIAFNAAVETRNPKLIEEARQNIIIHQKRLEEELKQKREGKQQPQTKDPMNLGR